MPSSTPLSRTHYVAPLEETPLVAVDTVSVSERPSNLWIDAWRDIRRRPLFYVAGSVVLFALVVALFPTLFTRVDPRFCELGSSNGGPVSGHPFGFTKQGCDVYSRIIFGARTSLTIGFLVTVLVTVIGVVIGSLAGFYGRWVDAVLSRIGDIFFAIPYILAAVVIMSVVPREQRTIIVLALAIGLFSWPGTARVLRGQILQVKSSDYVTSATALGVSRFRILVRHVLPNSIAPVIVITTIGFAAAIVAEATLSFLGIGLPESVMSWGSDISDAQVDLRNNPMTLIYPSIALSVTVLAFILLGEVVRDALDPKARARR
jgi:oligopeptide transport system permease protein